MKSILRFDDGSFIEGPFLEEDCTTGALMVQITGRAIGGPDSLAAKHLPEVVKIWAERRARS